eukprot:NP_494166.1 Uncharacterized protein CELE_F07E5.4 [Caenorhabditis elegans]
MALSSEQEGEMGDEREEFQTRGVGLEEVIEQMVRPLQKIVMAGKDQVQEFGGKKPPSGKYTIELMGKKIPNHLKKKRSLFGSSDRTRRATLVFKKKEHEKSTL